MQLQQHECELEQLEVQVLVVTFERPQLAANYVRATGWPWPVVTDEQRALYHAYGMEQRSIWQLYGWPAWWALRIGRRLGLVTLPIKTCVG